MTEIFTKPNVSEHEYNMHLYIYNLKILNVPKPISYDAINKIFQMEKINGMSISDYYGEKSSDIDSNIFKSIRGIIQTLFDVGIIYPDITGYNFIAEYDDFNEITDKIWIIDFEHATFNDLTIYDPNYDFVNEFINGLDSYNLEFA
jgi:tRNA A-37 threonylcarbamoyl transferase component Bud32